MHQITNFNINCNALINKNRRMFGVSFLEITANFLYILFFMWNITLHKKQNKKQKTV